ncbi:hypothetical protein R1T16_08485 [Flavobacterium sp. DG1-102-2]|uniref:hypothetical protein n=1 Tax=Flavobacterium sp. DG1-102-2 TaxID=3081663 RepID=UPI00294A8EA1|nr:hypothetical protein [Flavobacterium sp. DG1-102-2]MDV6168463.1 hypothetical protein [Flavobacterium sp. DG1-102-2]
MKKIINLNGTLVELNRVKSICINGEGFTGLKLAPNQIKILLSGKKEYVLNPEKRSYELIDIEDEILIEYPNAEFAYSNFLSLKEVWEEAINA